MIAEPPFSAPICFDARTPSKSGSWTSSRTTSGRSVAHGLDSRGRVGSLAHHVEALCLEQLSRVGAEASMVVDYENGLFHMRTILPRTGSLNNTDIRTGRWGKAALEGRVAIAYGSPHLLGGSHIGGTIGVSSTLEP